MDEKANVAAHMRSQGLVRDDANDQWVCPKCRSNSGNDWSQCEGRCPIKGSLHYTVTPSPTGR